MAALGGINNVISGSGNNAGSGNILGIASAAEAALRSVTSQGRTALGQTERARTNDQTRVSSTAQAVAQALNTSDVRTEKVAALQSAIASGSYNVPASEVAGKLVDHLLK